MAKQQLPHWDLSAYYSGLGDPKIKKDIKSATAKAKQFAEKYRGHITNKITPAFLRKALQESEKIYLTGLKPLEFAELLFTTNSNDPKIGAFRQMISKQFTDLSSSLIFFDLEITNLKESKIRELANTKELTGYKNLLIKLLRAKPHRLTEPEEIILAKKSLTSGRAFVRLFDERRTEKTYNFKHNGKTTKLLNTDITNLMHDGDRAKRKAAFEAMTAGLKDEAHLNAFIFNALGEDKITNDALAKFTHPLESRLLSNEVDEEIVKNLVEAVMENYDIARDFYGFKKELLGLKKMLIYDRYAPLAKISENIPFSKAKQIVLESFKEFSKEMADAAEKFFSEKWIDAEPRRGKRSGAFCSYGSPDLHPVVLVNYFNKPDDVQTLAHELGHGINAYLMRDLSIYNFDNPLVMAETASVFGEMLVFDKLRSQTKVNKEKLTLYMDKIDGILSTAFLQIAKHDFETQFHNLRKTKGELAIEEINQIWRLTQEKMLGKSVDVTDEYNPWWAYTPHFFHTPFYVHSYAFGELLVLSLYARYKQEGESFVPKYLKIMKTGSSLSPEEQLKPLGINLRDKQFWIDGLNLVRGLLREAKALAGKK